MLNGLEKIQKKMERMPDGVILAVLRSKDDLPYLTERLRSDQSVAKRVYAEFVVFKNINQNEEDTAAYLLRGLAYSYSKNRNIEDVVLYSNTNSKVLKKIKADFDNYFRIQLIVDKEELRNEY